MFKETVMKSFQAVKKDMKMLKTNLTEWVVYLESNQKHTEYELSQLQRRVRELEKHTSLRV